MYDIPILFIIFKRYRTTLQVFEVIKALQPKVLYIAADGPRNVEEERMCEQTRSIINHIDWPCQVNTLFQKHNLGCKYGPYTSISWFFEHEECGIILEDDCIPDPSFFQYARELLNRYKTDERVGMIAGYNPLNISSTSSYYFSRFKACWGWATWRRSWKNMDIELKNYNYLKEIAPLMVYTPKKIKHWSTTLNLIAQNKVAAWDWPWYFSLAAQNQLCIFPAKNLVVNVGFGEDATHCIGKAPENDSHSLEFPLSSPPSIVPYMEFEQAFEAEELKQGEISLLSRIAKYFPQPFVSFVKRILGRV